MKNPNTKIKVKVNIKVIIFSLIALVFLALTFFVDWLFIIGALVLVFLNHRELMRGKKGEKGYH